MLSFSKIIIALCEGPHDTAFLYRVLRNSCYKNFDSTIEDLPLVVKRFIQNGYSKVEKLESLKLNALINYNIPNKVLYKDNKLILLYAMGGDSDSIETSKRLSLIKEYLATLKNTSDSKELNLNSEDLFAEEENEYSFLFFYDADTDASKQVKKINKYLLELGIKEEINHNDFINKVNHKYGCYIFSEDGVNGTLENIMFSLIEREENLVLLEKAEEYFNLGCSRFKKRISVEYEEDTGTCKEALKKKSSARLYKKKSLLGIMGQLQNSGASNVVTIEHSDYIKFNNIVNSYVDEIASFFEKA